MIKVSRREDMLIALSVLQYAWNLGELGAEICCRDYHSDMGDDGFLRGHKRFIDEFNRN